MIILLVRRIIMEIKIIAIIIMDSSVISRKINIDIKNIVIMDIKRKLPENCLIFILLILRVINLN